MTVISRSGIATLLGVMLCLAAVRAASAQEGEQPPPFKPEEIDQLVAPIALYPDELLAQVLMASTYPLEIVQAHRWALAHPGLQGKALEDALQAEPWDPSVKSLVAIPQVLTMMDEKLDWTQKLGDAFLAQEGHVMDGVQRLRARALADGRLYSTKEQTVVEEQGAPGQPEVIRIEPTSPEIIYVPTYDPFVVYGPWPYPAYPPYYYYPPGYIAAPFITFGFGWSVGYVIWGGCDWHHHHVYIHGKHYDEFTHTHDHGGEWHHDPAHRRGVAYRDSATQNRYTRPSPGNPQAREAFRGRVGGPRPPGAFPSVGNAAQTSRESSRGNASRGSARSWGTHGAPGGGPVHGEGGGRGGGGMPSGGGGHGGGHGGGRR